VIIVNVAYVTLTGQIRATGTRVERGFRTGTEPRRSRHDRRRRDARAHARAARARATTRSWHARGSLGWHGVVAAGSPAGSVRSCAYVARIRSPRSP